MRLLIATDTIAPDVNGVSRFISQIQRHSKRCKFEIHVTSKNEFPTVPYPGYAEVRVAISRNKKVIKSIERFRPDWVHLVTEGPVGFATKTACSKLGIKFSTSYLTNFQSYAGCRIKFYDVLIERYLRHMHAKSMRVIVPAQSTLPRLRRLKIANSSVVPLGVDLELFSPQNSDYALFSDLKRPIFLYVGRIAVEKNVEDFLSLKLPGTKVVVGDGPLKSMLQRKHTDVLFLGYRFGVELAQIYASSDVFVFPSKTDTFGVVQLEALASGLPVAAFPVAGPLDVIGSSGAGILHHDLQAAAIEALDIPRWVCRSHAERFPESRSCELFFEELAMIKRTSVPSAIFAEARQIVSRDHPVSSAAAGEPQRADSH